MGGVSVGVMGLAFASIGMGSGDGRAEQVHRRDCFVSNTSTRSIEEEERTNVGAMNRGLGSGDTNRAHEMF
jgi:hypothetical protein